MDDIEKSEASSVAPARVVIADDLEGGPSGHRRMDNHSGRHSRFSEDEIGPIQSSATVPISIELFKRDLQSAVECAQRVQFD